MFRRLTRLPVRPFATKRNLGFVESYIVCSTVACSAIWIIDEVKPQPISEVLRLTKKHIVPPIAAIDVRNLYCCRDDYLYHMERESKLAMLDWRRKTARVKCMQADYNRAISEIEDEKIRKQLEISDEEVRSIFGV